MQTLASGTQIIYAREDTGGSIQNDNETVLLAPHKPLTVGKNVTATLATRLVEDKVCTVYSLPPEAAERQLPEAAERQLLAATEEARPEEARPEEADQVA